MELRGEKCKTLAGETEKVFRGSEKGMGCFFRFVQHLDFSAKKGNGREKRRDRVLFRGDLAKRPVFAFTPFAF